MGMTHDVIATCPVCDGELSVTRLQCGECSTTLEGRFSVGRFGRLGKEQLALLESFLRSRGNLRDMERELGLSYPTVRNRVEGLVRALGLAVDGDGASGLGAPPEEHAGQDTARPAAEVPAAARREVLERLARHELTAEAAAARLRALPREVGGDG
jgi:hypothetical protein